MKQFRDEFTKFVGLVVIGLVVGALLIGGVYWILDQFTDAGRHWLAVGLVFGVFIAYWLGIQTARAHRSGLERGLDLKVNAARAAAPAKPVLPQPAASRAAQFDDLLPKPAVIVARRDDNTQTIDL